MSLLLLFNEAAIVPEFIVMNVEFTSKIPDTGFESKKPSITFTKVD